MSMPWKYNKPRTNFRDFYVPTLMPNLFSKFVVKLVRGKKGISVIEILIVIFIIVVALVTLLGVAAFSLKISTSIKETGQADSLIQETIEAVRNFRDGTDWNTDGLGTLTSGLAYHLEKSTDVPPKWQFVQGEETINGFVRKVIFADVMRDANDDIVESGGALDPDTKKAIINLSWDDKTLEIITYFTNWKQ